MSLRQQNLGSIIKPGFNPLGASSNSYTYYLYSWGDNGSGQLGLGNTTSYSSPKQVGVLTDWLQISTGYQNSAAIKTDGTLWMWGMNSYGQLGTNNRTYYSSPKQIGALTTWASVSTTEHTLAVKKDGTLWAWGNNNSGMLGLGNITNYSSPKQVGSLTNWAYIFAPYAYSLAIKTDGTLWTWGYNPSGNLGLGNQTYYSSPKQVGALTTWKTLTGSGAASVLAIKTDGTLWAWGTNNQGQLGFNNRTAYSSPKQVGALTTWATGFAADGYFAFAIKTDGTLWSWGNNLNGQLGLGNLTKYSSPKQVGTLTNWSSVTSAGYNGLSIKTDGTLWSWGSNGAGSLGLGNLTQYSSPVQVGPSTKWSKISGGGNNVVIALGY